MLKFNILLLFYLLCQIHGRLRFISELILGFLKKNPIFSKLLTSILGVEQPIRGKVDPSEGEIIATLESSSKCKNDLQCTFYQECGEKSKCNSGNCICPSRKVSFPKISIFELID